MTVLKPGLALKSATCTTDVMVIRAPAGADVDLRCGGAPMVTSRGAAVALDPDCASGSLIGKRYVDVNEQYELLCTKGGDGALQINGEFLAVKVAKALPSSD